MCSVGGHYLLLRAMNVKEKVSHSSVCVVTTARRETEPHAADIRVLSASSHYCSCDAQSHSYRD